MKKENQCFQNIKTCRLYVNSQNFNNNEFEVIIQVCSNKLFNIPNCFT